MILLRERRGDIRDIADAFAQMQVLNMELMSCDDSSVRLLATKIQSLFENLSSYLDSNYSGWDR